MIDRHTKVHLGMQILLAKWPTTAILVPVGTATHTVCCSIHWRTLLHLSWKQETGTPMWEGGEKSAWYTLYYVRAFSLTCGYARNITTLIGSGYNYKHWLVALIRCYCGQTSWTKTTTKRSVKATKSNHKIYLASSERMWWNFCWMYYVEVTKQGYGEIKFYLASSLCWV